AAQQRAPGPRRGARRVDRRDAAVHGGADATGVRRGLTGGADRPERGRTPGGLRLGRGAVVGHRPASGTVVPPGLTGVRCPLRPGPGTSAAPSSTTSRPTVCPFRT